MKKMIVNINDDDIPEGNQLFIRGTVETYTAKVLEVDKPNRNGNVYPRKLVEENIARLQETIKNGGLIGELDTPTDSIIHFSNTSHLIKNVRLENDDLMVDYQILNTPCGKLAQVLIDEQVKIKIVPRGIGSIKDGVVQPNFKLVTFDIAGEM